MKQETVRCWAGFVSRVRVREYLEDQIFLGKAIRFRENKGWFKSVFTIIGDAEDMEYVYDVLGEWGEGK